MLGSSRKLGGAAEHLIDGTSDNCICRWSNVQAKFQNNSKYYYRKFTVPYRGIFKPHLFVHLYMYFNTVCITCKFNIALNHDGFTVFSERFLLERGMVLGSAYVCCKIGSKNSRHFVIQLEVKPKPIVTRFLTFSRVFPRLHAFQL